MTEVQAHSIRRSEESLEVALNRLQGNSTDDNLYEDYDEFLDELAKSGPPEHMPEPGSEALVQTKVDDDDMAEILENVDYFYQEDSDEEEASDAETIQEYYRQKAA